MIHFLGSTGKIKCRFCYPAPENDVGTCPMEILLKNKDNRSDFTRTVDKTIISGPSTETEFENKTFDIFFSNNMTKVKDEYLNFNYLDIFVLINKLLLYI